MEDIPPPQLRPGGVLIRNRRSLISAGTEKSIIQLAQKSLAGKARQRPDLVRKVLKMLKTSGWKQTLQMVRSRLDQPTPLGYSCAGEVISVASGVEGFAPGERVACSGASYATHAEVVFVPRNLCVRIPDTVSDDDASYVTLGAIAMQGVRQADIRVGETVVVIGLGLIGQLVAQIARASGAVVLGMDLDKSKVDLALQLGLSKGATTNEEIAHVAQNMTEGRGVDAVIIAASTPSDGPVTLAGELCRDRGKVVALGLTGLNVPRNLYYKKELDLRLSRSYGPGRYDSRYEEKGEDYPFAYVRWTENRNMSSFLRLVADGNVKLKPLTSHRFSIDEAESAYELIKTGSEPFLGVVLEYPFESEISSHVEIPSEKPRAAKHSGTIGLGIVGAGSFVKSVLLPRIKSISTVTMEGLVTATGITAQQIGRTHGFRYCSSEASELFNDKAIHAILIGTRHGLHADLVVQALISGKHVFVEKPLALNDEQLQRVIQTKARHPESVLMVGFNRRFSPCAEAIRDYFAQTDSPKILIYRVNAGAIPSDHWVHDSEEGGGRIIGEVCHFIDLMQSLCGDALPIFVTAQSVACKSPASVDEDHAAISVRFSDGSLGTIHYFANGPRGLPKERLEVFCQGRAALLDDFHSVTFIDGAKSRTRDFGAQDKGHAAELKAFFEHIQNGEGSPISMESMVATTRATFQAVGALRSEPDTRVEKIL